LILRQLADYLPTEHLKWKRTDVHRPQDEDNKLRGWSWKANVGGEVEVRPSARFQLMKLTFS
jgi:hypothetical protein